MFLSQTGLARNATFVALGVVLTVLGSITILAISSTTASADHNEFPNEEYCDVVFEFLGAICPDEFHGGFHGDDFVNADELGPGCNIPTFLFEPYLESGHLLWTEGRVVFTPNGNMHLSCRFDVPSELIVADIPSAQVTNGGICFGPLGPTFNTSRVLTPNGKIKLTCHFDYGS